MTRKDRIAEPKSKEGYNLSVYTGKQTDTSSKEAFSL